MTLDCVYEGMNLAKEGAKDSGTGGSVRPIRRSYTFRYGSPCIVPDLDIPAFFKIQI